MGNIKEKLKDKNFLVGLAILFLGVLILILVIGLLLNGGNKDKDKPNVVPVKPTEQNVKDTYGHTKEDAIKAVKQAYNSDSYTFSAEIRGDNKYVVTVENKDTKSKTVYLVEPDTLHYRVMPEEK